ncbi:GntP family transporter [Ignatzschineria ureiclastica]|uniref:GntP family transporter n=1 Tax=Ignatzschineria ureiclastica TaxID=472582 RepID=A0A2U2AFL0_9GAMM|nr:GntP family transporter [Ignatzschineria ureiclastica]PWD81445.1 GntP family transporter [Ignatzschineria ureiclastica]GHA00756.1 inner membrane permease YgbN [Ignatzschineria ureiclastica]
MSQGYLLLVAILGVLGLLLMVIRFKIQPFVALLLVSIIVALASGIPMNNVVNVMTSGMGKVLGSVTMIVGLGAMLGQIIEKTGGAESIANYFSRLLGAKRAIPALTASAFILGIPVFFDVGFIILAPIIYGFARVAKVSPLKFGLPVAGIMLTVHVSVPPHPGPISAAELTGADIGLLTIIGLGICIFVGVIGYFTSKWITRKEYKNLLPQTNNDSEVVTEIALEEKAKNAPNPYLIAFLIIAPIFLIMLGTVSSAVIDGESSIKSFFNFLGAPVIALMIGLILAFYFLGIRRRYTLTQISDVMGEALPAAAVVIMVTGAGGVFGNVLVESGVGKALSDLLTSIGLPIMLAAFLISLALRASQGSATVAILTTAGLLSESLIGMSGTEIVLVTLAMCFGGLGLSHVNDSGFWIVTKYLGLSVEDGLKTWTVLTTILGVSGFLITWLVWSLI